MAAPPDGDADRGGDEPAAGSKLDDRPPFLSWRGIYLLVIAALAAQVVIYTLLSRATQ